MSETVYARVVDGEILEFPVHLLHINNRNHSVNDYRIVEFETKPYIPPFYTVIPEPKVVGNRVICKWNLIPQSLDGVLNDLWRPTTLDKEDEGYKETILIEDVPQEVIDRVTYLVREYVGKQLDTFVQTKGYDDIKSAATYANSAVAKFKADADRALHLRDMCWVSIYEYLDYVMLGELPIPRSTQDIDNIIPQLTWE